jgi:signal transduction histidine kinase
MDLVATIAAAAEACQPVMDARLQRFGLHLPEDALDVHGDPVRLTQVLVNLLDNASKYTPKGGRIELTVTVYGPEIKLRVTDTGIGITAAALPHVFEPFVQGTHAVDFSAVGLGIGLTVVRELVEAHGGRVVAHSDGPGLGSEFVVTLPLERPAVRPA